LRNSSRKADSGRRNCKLHELATPKTPDRRTYTPPVMIPNALAACVAGTGAVCTVGATAVGAPFKVALASYMTASVASYCLRRGILHRWPNGKPLGAAEVLRRHIQYEDEWHMPNKPVLQGRLWHLAHIGAWILFFQPIYPILEMALYPWDLAAFWFYYPSARGAGLVIDSRELRRRGKRGSRAQVFRLDWHRFELNVGKAYPPPNTGRHPPSILCNLPHVDLPQRSVRHWPWRQHTGRLMQLLPQPCTPAPSASTTNQGTGREAAGVAALQ
jgi:hypothetical protein